MSQNQAGKSYSYLYDTNNNRKELAVSGTESYSVKYVYDRNNRLLSEITDESGVLTTNNYTYDYNGNQILKTESTIAPAGSGQATVTLNISHAEPSELAATISKYDGFNRLIKVENDAGISQYGYYPNNLRSYKDVNGSKLSRFGMVPIW